MERHKSKIPTFRKIFMKIIRHYAFNVHIHQPLKERYNSLTVSQGGSQKLKVQTALKEARVYFLIACFHVASSCSEPKLRLAFQLNIFWSELLSAFFFWCVPKISNLYFIHTIQLMSVIMVTGFVGGGNSLVILPRNAIHL